MQLPAKRLHELRVRAGISREELAVAARISVRYVQALERGEREEPSVTIAQRIARALGVNVNDIWPIDCGDGDTSVASVGRDSA